MLLASLALAALPPPGALGGPGAAARREVFKHASARPPPPPADTAPGWDIDHYVLRVRIDPAERLVTGFATLTASRSGEGALVLHAPADVSEVWVDGAAVAWELVEEDTILLDPAGETTTVEVAWTYDDALPNGLQWDRDVIWSFHEPIGARTWLPVYDHPSDKATLDWEVTAPDGWVVAANGVLTETAAADEGWTTWRYTFDAPIATYLMAVHLSAYSVSVDSAVLGEGTELPIYTWAYPGREEEAAQAFAETGEMIAYFSERYAPFPWPSYGNAMAPFGGAMEHTTCVTFSDAIVGTSSAELVNVHELGHHWWGDDVTLGDWADIWLNEGFATYTEALWYERAFGQAGLTEYAAYLTDSFFEWKSLEGSFPMYDPLYMWGGTVYDKGGLVVHMLRGVLGDDRFFAGLADYEAAHHLGNAVTTDLEASFQSSTGEDLGWFFDQWVYGKGEPTYTWSWAASGGEGAWQLDLAVEQDLPEFRMPVPFRVTYADGTSEDVVVTVEGARTEAGVCVASEPVSVELDPDLWVLRAGEVEVAGAPGAPTCYAVTGETPTGGCGCGTDRGVTMALAGLASVFVLRRRRAA